MIQEMLIGGNQIIMYSIGQAAARIDRSPQSMRRMERSGAIPAPFKRSDTGQRLYSIHECKALELCFKKHSLRERVKIPEAFTRELEDAFAALRQIYSLPKWTLTMIPKEYR